MPGFVEETPSFRDYIRHDNSGPSVVLSRCRNETHSESYVNRLQLITMPSFIPAFSLSKRSWGFIDVNGISDIQWDTNAYENLQMDHERKESVRRLVSTHRTFSSGFDDFISGKGKGLVFLLHGPPGSGKTMTAGMLHLSQVQIQGTNLCTRNRRGVVTLPSLLHVGRGA